MTVERIDQDIAAFVEARPDWWTARYLAAAEVLDLHLIELLRHPNRVGLLITATRRRPDVVADVDDEPELTAFTRGLRERREARRRHRLP